MPGTPPRRPVEPFVVWTRRKTIVTSCVCAYTLFVGILVLKAFDFSGRIHFDWTLGLIGATLPWSTVSILYAWALIHGAGLGFLSGMYLLFGGLNGFLIGLLVAQADRRWASRKTNRR